MNMVDSKEACLDNLMLNILIEIEIETSETSNKANKTTTQIVRSILSESGKARQQKLYTALATYDREKYIQSINKNQRKKPKKKRSK